MITEETLLSNIDAFIKYGIEKLGLNSLDAVAAKNYIYADLNIYPSKDKIRILNKNFDVNYFVDFFTKYFEQIKIDQNTIGINISRLFNYISPTPSMVENEFKKNFKISPKKATDYLYNLGVNNYYIHKRDIDKNIEWVANFKEYPTIEISINLSKPEKNNKDIAKLLTAKQIPSYPSCMLCEENLGFAGNEKKPPRHNLRIIPLKINNEDWFLQFSPYGYFNEHMILVDKKHEPMEISPRIYKCLFSFCDQFPHYTIVSNCDLPIVGGSILNHEHFQGGNYVFPLQKAKSLINLKLKQFPEVKISYLDFYNSAFKFTSKNKVELLDALTYVLKVWRNYSDKSANIIAKNNGKIQNTTTPILRKIKNEYEFILILRNNGTSAEFPDGIFHVHPEYHAIKQEGIGVIEAMGRFILPARLVRQIREVEEVVKNKYPKNIYLKKYPDLIIFDHMINTLKNNPSMSAKEYINIVGQRILINTAVFKPDKSGRIALNKFIAKLIA